MAEFLQWFILALACLRIKHATGLEMDDAEMESIHVMYNTHAWIPCEYSVNSTILHDNATIESTVRVYTHKTHFSFVDVVPNEKFYFNETGLMIHNVKLDDVTQYACEVKRGNITLMRKVTHVEVFLVKCTFNEDFCDFENIGSEKWLRRSTPTPTDNTGPDEHQLTNGDMMTPRGSFIYLEADNVSFSQELILRSTNLTLEARCMELKLKYSFFMYGATMGSLAVYGISDDGKKYVIDEQIGDHWQMWHTKMTKFPPGRAPRSFDFIAKRGLGVESDIALDDIEIVAASKMETHKECDLLVDAEMTGGMTMEMTTADPNGNNPGGVSIPAISSITLSLITTTAITLIW